ncbi:MAG: acyl-ACP--UDP-N-acetylglucosamine O-acyltransferase [Prevotellaceae bacterium]|nr:acyl-ACP--UDP-N-acetylglucosamine O-acyltransferase [Prevotellaceae bacterium]
MAKISPLAFIDPAAQIGENCEIGPFCFIDKNVVIGDNNVLMNSVTLLDGTRIGNGNTFFPGAVIGAIPQDLKFRGEESTVEIGDNNRIRENVTIHRGTASKGRTLVGSNNLIMENAHIAHDCEFGSGIIMGNSSKLAGEVIVDDNAIISAVVLVHQFCRIAGYTMVQGGCRTSQDIPPFVIAAREPIAYAGLNIVGLRRRKFSPEIIHNIHETYRLLYNSNLTVKEAIEQITYSIPMSKEIQYIVDFVSSSQRGIIR